MPRPYGLILGEGMVKNQRWPGGLGDVSQAELDAAGVTSGDLSLLNNVYGPSASAVSGSGSVLFTSLTGTTLGNWISNNGVILLIGGIVGLLLFKRR